MDGNRARGQANYPALRTGPRETTAEQEERIPDGLACLFDLDFDCYENRLRGGDR
jgi:hypothetical protein